MKVIFCGYRDWALNVINKIKSHPRITEFKIISSKNKYDNEFSELVLQTDMIIFLGWSWIIPKEITKNHLCLGVHPSDLPCYRGGSPIQNQIIDGVTKTKVSLMTLDEKLDAGSVWLKNDLNLEGDNIHIIFKNIENSTIDLFETFFNSYPNIKATDQNLELGSYFKRRKPEQSRLEIDDFKSKSLKEIYDFVRCLTDPYPNAFIEDKSGNKLIFKEVRYIEKK